MAKLFFTAVQGAADAFVEATIQTALTGQTKSAYRVNEIGWEFDGAPPRPLSNVAAQQDAELCITRRTKAAMPALNDVDVIMKKHWSMIAGTAVGYVMQPVDAVCGVWTPPNPDALKISDGAVIIVEDPLYVQLDSTLTGLTLTVVGYIDYDLVTVTEVERLTLIAQSLS